MTLESLMQGAKVWRAGGMPSAKGIPTGFPTLDSLLPGRGWPRAALTEILTRHQGIGALRLILPAIARLSRERRWVIWVSPPHIPYAPALAAMGVDLTRVLIVGLPGGPRTRDDQMLWAFEQALRFRDCGVALAWIGVIEQLKLRRLQLACEVGDTWGVIFRAQHLKTMPSPAALRLSLAPGAAGDLNVDVLKCRGGVRSHTCRLEF